MNSTNNANMSDNFFILIFKHRNEIMGLVAIWIFFFHSQFFKPIINDDILVSICLFIKGIGFCGVDIFLFLSGMGLVKSITHNTLKQYYINRIRRIIIPYFIISTLIALSLSWPFSRYIRELTFYNMLTENLYSFLWFFPLITLIYLFFPVYYKIFKFAPNKYICTLLSLFVWFSVAFLIRNSLRDDLWGVYNRIPVVIIGTLFGYLSLKRSFNISILNIISLVLILCLGIYFAFVTNNNLINFIIPGANCYLANLLIAVSAPFLVALLSDLINHLKCMKPITVSFAFLGRISLELYAVQEIIMYKTKDFFLAHSEIPFCGVATFFIVVIAAYVLHLLTKYTLKFIDFVVSAISTLNEKAS